MTDIDEKLLEIFRHREEIKEQFIRAWLAVNIPRDNFGAKGWKDWLINHVQVVEQWSEDRTKVTWSVELKPDPVRYTFKPGDYIKPTPNSPADPEHWRYVVVKVFRDCMWVIDLNNNIQQIDGGDDSDFEIANDPSKSDREECEQAKRGELDERFEHWAQWDKEKKRCP